MDADHRRDRKEQKLTTDKHGLTGITKIAGIAKSVDWKARQGIYRGIHGTPGQVCTDKRGSGKSHRLRPGPYEHLCASNFSLLLANGQ
jgi:hypothetical protein